MVLLRAYMVCLLWTGQRLDGAAVDLIVLPQAKCGNGLRKTTPLWQGIFCRGGHPARESPAPCAPLVEVRALRSDRGVITMPGVDDGAVAETVEDSRLHVFEQ
jgi:hypothetical protein